MRLPCSRMPDPGCAASSISPWRQPRRLLGVACVLVTLILLAWASPPAHAGESGRPVPTTDEKTGAKGTGEAPASDPRYEDAQRLYKAGKSEAAIYLLQQVQKDYPNDTRILFKLGEMAIASKNWAYAIEVLRRAADLRPQDVQARLVLMDVYKAYQMPIQEIKAGREILQIDPRQKQALFRLSQLYEEQAMGEDEERTRRTLADVSPDDYANLKRLASMLESEGQLWEATLYYEKIVERFPRNKEDAAALARLYGLDGDRYHEFRQWDRTRRMPGPGGAPLTTAYRHAYYTHKRDLRMFDPWELEANYQTAVSNVDKVPYLDVNLGYHRLFITENGQLGLTGHYRDQTWQPLTTAVSGNRNVTSNGVLLDYTHRWGGDRTIVRMRGGYESVAVGGNSLIVNPAEADTTTFPFTEQRKYGGTILVGDVTLDHRFNRNFGARLFVHHLPIEDIEAYSRMLSRTGGGVALNYNWPDGTFVEGMFQKDGYSDGNNRNYATFNLSYPIFISGPIRDRQGHRRGYLFPVPDHQVRIDYRFENLSFTRVSNLYESFPSDNRHTVILSGQHRLGGRLHLYEEGLWETGQVVQSQLGFKAGFVYEDPDNLNRVMLLYHSTSERVREGSQINPGLQGGSRVTGVELKAVWHFGTAPKKDPTLPRRHK